jgi:two-component system osmolarity sensor histidine kinase EnvZ
MPNPLRVRATIKRMLPSNLFGRALLILVLPMLISQVFMAHIFYDRHWSSVERNMEASEAGDIAWLYEVYSEERSANPDPEAALKKVQALGNQLGAEIQVTTARIDANGGKGRDKFPDLYKSLDQRFEVPIEMRDEEREGHVRIRMAVEGGALDIVISRKWLTSQTTTLFIAWMIGSSLLLTLISILFLRNQVRPIVTLARVAEQFGLGQDVAAFKPSGASEVRRAGRAFQVMAERINRHVQNRTEMLAGISHDLRTPLTRMKLEMELATGLSEATRSALTTDIDEMGRMIDEYLSFARGDAGELAEPIDLDLLLSDIVADYKRSKRAVYYTKGAAVELMLRPQAIRRALTNLIDNALRYGDQIAHLTLEQSATFVRIKVADEGPGIAEHEQEMVFKPFTRLEPSRNTSTGGVGLGLSIARAIAQSHGGDVTLDNQRDAKGAIRGLEVTIRLPRAVQPTQ